MPSTNGRSAPVHARPLGIALALAILTSAAAAQDAPTATPDVYTAVQDDSLTVAANGVLANDAAAPGDSLVAVLEDPPEHGTIRLLPDGSFVYHPAPGFLGIDTFSYRAYRQSTERFVIDSLQSTATLDASVNTPFGSDSDSDSSSLRGFLNLDLIPNEPPFRYAHVSGIRLTLAEEMELEFRFGSIVTIGGIDVVSAPDSLVLTVEETGAPSAVANDAFVQNGNRVRVEGTVGLEGHGLLETAIPTGPQPIELDTLIAISGLLAEADTLIRLEIPILFEDITEIEGVGVILSLEGTIVAHARRGLDVASNPATVTLQVNPIATRVEADLPGRTAVFEAPYPNPFTMQAVLPFSLARPAEVRLAVFDVQGRVVARLADGFFPAGAHRVGFTADGLPAGVYFARLTVDGQASTRKLVRAGGSGR